MKRFLVLFSIILSVPLLGKTNEEKPQVQKSLWARWVQKDKESRCLPNPFVTKAFELASKINPQKKVVIDLGTGAGRNIRDILKQDVLVYAYDAEPESIKLINQKYENYLKNKKLHLFQIYFENITSLPKADMIIAWNILPFMKKDKFPVFWSKIVASLKPNGIFTGTFFGEKHYAKRCPKFAQLFRMTRAEIMALFSDFQIIDFYEELEYDEASSQTWGTDQYDHVYKITAKKKDTAREGKEL